MKINFILGLIISLILITIGVDTFTNLVEWNAVLLSLVIWCASLLIIISIIFDITGDIDTYDFD
jgi:cytochrome c biogenesis protein CcdA